MDKKIFATTSLSSLGCTFLEWSLHYLANQNFYFSVDSNSSIELVTNPLKSFGRDVEKINAHSHQKNHPLGYDNLKYYIEKIHEKTKQSGNEEFLDMYSVYLGPKTTLDIIEDLDYDIEDVSKNKQYMDNVKQSCYEDFEMCIDFLHKNNIPIIYVDNSKYHFFDIRHTEAFTFSRNNTPKESKEIFNEYINTFFSNSIDYNSKPIWDIREIVALDIRPYDEKFKKSLGFNLPYYHIDFRMWWADPMSSIIDIANFLEIKINNSRWEKWKDVCIQWKNNHKHYLEFYFSIDHIIDSIINGWYFKLPVLSFSEEAIIQHILIYKHGLNLKTWELEKFPSNTQDLHKLLEHNIHDIPKLY